MNIGFDVGTTAPLACQHCGSPYPSHNYGCPTQHPREYYQLTEVDIRRIVREELELAKEKL